MSVIGSTVHRGATLTTKIQRTSILQKQLHNVIVSWSHGLIDQRVVVSLRSVVQQWFILHDSLGYPLCLPNYDQVDQLFFWLLYLQVDPCQVLIGGIDLNSSWSILCRSPYVDSVRKSDSVVVLAFLFRNSKKHASLWESDGTDFTKTLHSWIRITNKSEILW